MEKRSWVHPLMRTACPHVPPSAGKPETPVDDVYRSLAGFVRMPRVPQDDAAFVNSSGGLFPPQYRIEDVTANFREAVRRAKRLAQSPLAKRIPGFTGERLRGRAARGAARPASSSRTVWTLVVLISLGACSSSTIFFSRPMSPRHDRHRLFTPESLGFFGSLELVRVSGFDLRVLHVRRIVGCVVASPTRPTLRRKAVFTCH